MSITKPLLAYGLKEEDYGKLKFPVLCSVKLDGIRCVKEGGQALTRKFKKVPNRHIFSVLGKDGFPNGLDGELMLRKPDASFQEITSAVMSFEGSPDFVYWVFDYVSNGLEEPYQKRVRNLLKSPLAEFDNVKIVKPLLIENMDQLFAYEKKCVEKGYEGIMIRDPYGKYKCGRSTLREGILLKVKRFVDAEAEIIGFEERQKNTNVQERNELGYAKRSSAKAGMVGANTLGAFLVRDLKTKLEFSIGSGLDDELRSEIWSNTKKYSGKIVRYKYQNTGIKDKPRFPTFSGFRHPDDM